MFQPDLLYVSAENLGILTDAGAEGVPDLIIEILNPGTRMLDLGPKKLVFAKLGVKELWIVDPEARTIDQFDFAVSVDSPAHHHSAAAALTSALLPGLSLDCARVFAW